MEQQSIFVLVVANLAAFAVASIIEKDVETFPVYTGDRTRKPVSLWSEWSEPAEPSKDDTEWEGQEEVAQCECDLQLTQVNNKLRRLVDQLNTTIKTLDTKYFILKENYLDLKDDNMKLKQNNSLLLLENNNLTSENCKLNQTIKDFKILNGNLITENDKLKIEIDNLNLKIRKLNKTLEEINEENAQLWNFTTKVSKQIVMSDNRGQNESKNETAEIQWNLAELQSLQEDVWQYKNKCEAYSQGEVAEQDSATSELADMKKKLEFLVELNQKKCNQTIRNLDMVHLENRYYYVSSQGFALRWHDAREFCIENHLSLVHIETSEENNRLIAHTHGTHGVYLWTGGIQKVESAGYEWVGTHAPGRQLEFTDWVEDHPTQSTSQQNCISLWTFGETVKWSDRPCTIKLRFICEMQDACEF